eukprot:4072543-Pyramimonas_sp.AAC.1
MGDWNARVHCATSGEEAAVIGKHTFDPENTNPLGRAEESVYNRHLFLTFSQTHRLKAANTFFQKDQSKLATYREPGTALDSPFKRGTHEQLDFFV